MAKSKPAPKPDTIVTLTLPSEGGIQREGTLLIQRGNLAFTSKFNYTNVGDIASAIRDATNRLVEIEQAPPPDIKTTDKDKYTPVKQETKPAEKPAPKKKVEEGDPLAVDGDLPDERPQTDVFIPGRNEQPEQLALI